MRWDRSTKWALAAAGAIFYFSTALWLHYSYVPIKAPVKDAVRLFRPVFKYESSNYAFVSVAAPLDDFSDSSAVQERSPFVIYENDRPLGPAHGKHSDIAEYGLGRFSHWKGIGFIFSTSNNSDPNNNGRLYWAIRP